MRMSEKPVAVTDSSGAANDPELPSARLALDPATVKEEFESALPRPGGGRVDVRIRKIKVIRHKPGRRCVIEYSVKVSTKGQLPQKVALLGKIRARRFGNEGFRLLHAIWNAGFQSDSADGISVPEPIGVVAGLRMWLQRKVPGEVCDRLLPQMGPPLAARIAEAIHKLHRANIPTERNHTMADELRILHEHLPKVNQYHPEFRERINRVLTACDRLGASVPEPATCGIHRDFYPAQILVAENRLYLLDFDLYCKGDPGLDIGNFIGHTMEKSLREHDDPQRLFRCEEALEERFLELTGEQVRPAIDAYKVLTLVRQIYLSTQFEERRPFTGKLLALCEKLLRLPG